MVSIQSTLLIASAIALVLFVNGGEAIKCFECNSHNDSRCAEAIPPKELEVDCGNHKKGPEYSFCRKITQIIEFSVNNLPPDTRTIRGCGFVEGNYKNKCYQRSGYGGRQEVCACDNVDLCNGAATIKASFGLLLTAFIVFIARV
ncbi:unnamed protein product [Diamesa serratosioi]